MTSQLSRAALSSLKIVEGCRADILNKDFTHFLITLWAQLTKQIIVVMAALNA